MLDLHQRKKRLGHHKRRFLRYHTIGCNATYQATISGRTYTTTSEYNARGELTKLTYPDSSIAERTYHDTGALHLLRLDGSTISTRTYDDGRRLTGETLGNGVTETRTYSTDNLLTGISYGGTGTSIGNLSYTWDANKNKTSETIGGTMSGYGFTSAGTTYDDEDRLTGYARTSGTFTQSWNLTKVGDWTSVTTNGTAQNRTHGPTHELLTAGGQSLETDPKGNITLLPTVLSSSLTPQASRLIWDFDNKLRGADLGNNSSVDVNFQYDALGRRVARTGTGGSVVYVQHDQQTIADYPVGGVASTPTNRYVYASYIDEPVVRKAAGTSGTIHYYHRNQQYSITAMTTSTGAVAERYAYAAYGQPTILNASGSVLTSSAVGNRYTYTGREWDETLGLHHFRARWMSPLAGRFLGRDPIGYWGSQWGLYEYCGSRPQVMIDPYGLSWSWLDFWNHYRNGHGRPVTLAEIGLIDLYRQVHRAKAFPILSNAIYLGQVFVNCENGPGPYSLTVNGPSGHDYWNSTNVVGLFPLGNSSVSYTTTVDISWTCEHCCASDGEVKPTSIDIEATARFRLVDAFTDTWPGVSNPSGPATEQGKCVYECWNKHIANRRWDWSNYRSCRYDCKRKNPTNDPWGIPYGITGEWQEDMQLSYRRACDKPLAEIRDPRWE